MKRILLCPKCKTELQLSDKSLKCKNGHSYDIAKQGYTNLVLGNSGSGGDDKEMCRSRHNFHNKDYYKCLSDKLADICSEYGFKTIIDAGCGEGYYLRKIRNKYKCTETSFDSFCGIDLAKEAVAIAARNERDVEDNLKIEYAVAGIFDMPVSDCSVNCILSVFAPVPEKEAFRVLKSSGILIVVSPGEKHLEGLKDAIYEKTYDNETDIKEFDGFVLSERLFVKDTITVQHENICELFHLTPFYWKTSEKDASKLSELNELITKIEFILSIYKKVENFGTFDRLYLSKH